VDCIIISLSDETGELAELARSIGYTVKEIFVQRREKPGPYFVGRGKMEEIGAFVEHHTIECAVVNDVLTPSTWFSLERHLGIPVYDRIRLILEIFADRARKREGQLQVQLAKLRYERPFVRELFHRVKHGEKPGFLGGGEYVVADYYEMIKKQMKKIKKELEKIEKEREVRRSERRKRGFYLVSIAGYTNAGKSSLLNRMTGVRSVVEDRYFSTLAPKTSRPAGKQDVPLLFTDTVGFIDDLPHWLIDAFRSTLEEVALADVIIVLVDMSDDTETMKRKARTTLSEIQRLKKTENILFALSKCDTASANERATKKREMDRAFQCDCIPISAQSGENIAVLCNAVDSLLPAAACIHVEMPPEKADGMVRWLNTLGQIRRFSRHETIEVDVVCSNRVKSRVIGRCEKEGFLVREYES
jgi:GTP-binding protein HflX